MKILVVGAGAIGGYFGGRLLEKGEDVTFLVREKRKQQLNERGLKIHSLHGNINLKPNTIVSGENVQPYDLIVLATKAYHLESVLTDIQFYVGKNTMILPLLNGISHLDILQDRFGKDTIVGGLCFIETTLDENGYVIQSSLVHDLVFGELSGEQTDRIQRLNQVFSGTKANLRLSDHILQEMWHKYIFITTFSGVTTIMRAPIGPIRETVGGQEFISELIQELVSITRYIGVPVADTIDTITYDKIMQLGDAMKSSMQRDMEKGLPVEADHLQGYYYQMARNAGIKVPLLQVVYGNLKVYESEKLG